MMATKTFTQIAVLGLYTETPLHCGAESAVGYVDLPVQRERHTNFPVIPGSTIKGVLRDELKTVDRKAVFGEQDSPGQVSFGDGMLVAFPVRSSHYPFHWITCPFVLERLSRSLAGVPRADDPGRGKAWAKGNDGVLLEELAVEKQRNTTLFPDGNGGLGVLLKLLPENQGFAYTRSIFLERLLVLNDDDFRELVESGTEVLTRIKLNIRGTTTQIKDKEEIKKVREELEQELKRRLGHEATEAEVEAELKEALQGNMFVEEVVPPEALFVTALRSLGNGLLKGVVFPPLIRFGGDETIGRGLTHVTRVGGN